MPIKSPMRRRTSGRSFSVTPRKAIKHFFRIFETFRAWQNQSLHLTRRVPVMSFCQVVGQPHFYHVFQSQSPDDLLETCALSRTSTNRPELVAKSLFGNGHCFAASLSVLFQQQYFLSRFAQVRSYRQSVGPAPYDNHIVSPRHF